jgi:Nif-specific regulatory protein
MPALSDPTSPPTEAKLVAVTGPRSGEVLPLSEAGTMIGRDTSHAICLADLALSRSHCAIEMVDGVWRIRDCHSSNGTFVNGVRVSEQSLNDRDRIELGGSVFIFVRGGAILDAPPIDDRPSSLIDRLEIAQTAYLRQDSATPPSADAERNLRALLALSTTIHVVETEDELYERIFDALGTPVPAEQIAVVVADRGGEGRIAAVRQLARTRPVAVSRVVFTQAMQERIGLLTRETTPAAAPQSILCVPLVVRELALGAIYLTTSQPSPFDRDDLEFATAVANVAAGALDHTRHIAWLRDERTRLQHEVKRDQRLVGRSAAIERVYDMIAKVARSDATVLITGETGTGKELVARLVHAQSARAQRPFVAVNCAALTDTLLESELFGHERGAFTGAHTQKKGKLEVADGGTVFLDEIGELPAPLQTKLLRALQLHEFDRVGGTRPVRVDIRVVAATNRDLTAEVAAGRFRSDLYHRLHVVEIHVPALRERRDDIPILAGHFVDRFARTSARPIRGIAPDALGYLMAYDWPGNVRELENTIERAIVLGSSDFVTRDDLPDALLDVPAPAGSDRQRFHEAVRDAKIRVIEEAFREARGSYIETARLLGLNANYLHRLIKNLQLKPVLEREH